MSIHHFNRLRAHFDASTLRSDSEKAVLAEIAYCINSKRRGEMTFSNSFLAERTGYSETSVQKAIKGLLDKGLIARQRNTATSAKSIYDLLIECPADCKKKGHYAPWEKALKGELSNPEQGELSEVSKVNLDTFEAEKNSAKLTANRDLTNKENIELNTETENSISDPPGALLSFADFKAAVHSVAITEAAHKAVNDDLNGAYLIALEKLNNSSTNITSPKAWFASYYRKQPHAFVPYSASAEKAKAERPGFSELANAVCRELEVSYELEILIRKSLKDKFLKLHQIGALNAKTAGALIEGYNATASEQDTIRASYSYKAL